MFFFPNGHPWSGTSGTHGRSRCLKEISASSQKEISDSRRCSSIDPDVHVLPMLSSVTVCVGGGQESGLTVKIPQVVLVFGRHCLGWILKFPELA